MMFLYMVNKLVDVHEGNVTNLLDYIVPENQCQKHTINNKTVHILEILGNSVDF